MSLWKTHTLPSKQKVDEIDVDQLTLRLQTIVEQGNIEIIQLAIQSMLEEIKERHQCIELEL